MRLSRSCAALVLLFLLAALLADSASAATTTLLRPDSVLSNNWAVVGAGNAAEALDDNVDPTITPGSADYINAGFLYFPKVELGLTTSSISGLQIQGASAWFYTPNTKAIVVEAISEGKVLGTGTSHTTGWHSFPISLNGSQSQLDNLVLSLTTAETTGTRQVYAAFVKLVTIPAPAVQTTRLRPDGDIATSQPWSIVGASTAHDALDDNVTETEVPNSSDRITTSSLTAVTEVALETTHIEGSVLQESKAWFYTLNAKRTVVAVTNGGYTLTKATVESPGWHSIPVALGGSQSQLDNLRLKFSGSYAGPFEVSAAFFLVKIRKPPESIYWGARIDGEPYGSTHDAPWDYSVWDIFQEHTANKSVSTVDFGQPPPWAPEGTFSPEPLDDSYGRQAIPFMTMGSEANFPSGEDVTLEDIVNDKPAVLTKLREWAQAVREYNKPFFFRWEWEMNGNWYQFGREAAEDSTKFVLAWRRFHDIAEEAGATNITWVWCPNTSYPGSTPIASLYPGDAYVDWTCVDGYNEGEGAWRSFSEVFKTTYSELLKLAPTKPIMIGETASDESMVNSKAGWITSALTNELPERFPEVKSLNWFNWNRDGHEWVIESSPTAQTAFATSISSPYYAPGEFGSLPLLTPIEPLP